jgi:hypothetical protein
MVYSTQNYWVSGLFPLSGSVSKTLWDVECSRHSRTNTTVFCCCYTDTLAAVGPEKGRLRPTGDADLKRLLCGEHVGYSYAFFADVLSAGLRHNRWGRLAAPVVWGAHCLLVRLLCGCFENRLPILVVLEWSCLWILHSLVCNCVWSLLAGTYLYTGGETAASQ